MGRQRNANPAERWQFKSAVDMARSLPLVSRPLSAQPTTLSDEERELLAQCNAAIETVKAAFWAAGKALQNVRDGRLYRADYSSFPAYCEGEWDMSEAQANKLIRMWPICEALDAGRSNASNDPTRIRVGRKLNPAQVWELVPVADAWDAAAAAHVFNTVVEVDGVAVTAKVLQRAVGAVDLVSEFDAAVVAEQIQASLAAGPGEPEPVDLAARAERAVPLQFVRRLARQDAAAAGAYLDELQRQIDRCRALLPAQAQPQEVLESADA